MSRSNAGDKAEDLYERLSRYRFATRFLEGRKVVDLSPDAGFGPFVLSQVASRVVVAGASREAADGAASTRAAPNVSFEPGDAARLPYEDGAFDAAVAFGAMERAENPESLVREAKRLLGEGGVFIVSVPETLSRSGRRGEGNGQGMYVLEFEELLQRHFERVELYRQGAVAGSVIFAPGESLSSALPESASFSGIDLSFADEPPTPHSIVAVCSDSPVKTGGDKSPYLLLDRDRLIFDECDDRREDLLLLQSEIKQMQRTEVQAFQDAIKNLRNRLERSESRVRNLEARAQNLEAHNRNLTRHIHEMESSHTWRIFSPYRRMRERFGSLRESFRRKSRR